MIGTKMEFKTLEFEIASKIEQLYKQSNNFDITFEVALEQAKSMNWSISTIKKMDTSNDISTHEYGKLYDMVEVCVSKLSKLCKKTTYKELEQKLQDTLYNLKYERENRTMVIDVAKKYIDERIEECNTKFKNTEDTSVKDTLNGSIAAYTICRHQVSLMR